jgi:hypothetical protein
VCVIERGRISGDSRKSAQKEEEERERTYAARVVLLLDLNRALHAVFVLAQTQAVAPAHALQHAAAERLAATRLGGGVMVMVVVAARRRSSARGRGRGKVLRGELHGDDGVEST